VRQPTLTRPPRGAVPAWPRPDAQWLEEAL